MNRLDERRRAVEQARDAFLRAAAALTEWPANGVLSFALLEGALGLMHVAEADAGEVARAKVIEALERIKKSRDGD